MPPKRNMKETLIFLLNIGASKRGPMSNDVMGKMKYIVKHLFQKKIFLRPKDEIIIILMGSDLNENRLHIDNVYELCEARIPDWDLLQDFLAIKKTNHTCDWMDAFTVAFFSIENECLDSTSKTLIVMSDFKRDCDSMNQFEPNIIMENLEKYDVKLLIIGSDPLDEISTDSLTTNEKVIQKLSKKSNTNYLTFDNAMAEVRFYKKVPTNPMPCYFDLELGTLAIPVASYVKVSADSTTPWKMCTINKNSGEPVLLKPETKYFNENKEPCEKEDIISAYMYGGEAIPFLYEDINAMQYNSGEKSLKIVGFANKKDVHIEYWYTSNVNIFIPVGSKQQQRSFCELAQAMVNEDTVAIARKVYRRGLNAKMVALFPSINVEDEPWCLVQVELPFREDYTSDEFTPLTSVIKQVTHEQETAVHKLIRSLALRDTDEDVFLPGYLPDPATQHRWNVLAYRALNPDKPVPPMEDYLKDVFQPPESIRLKSIPRLERVSELFQLKEEQEKRSKDEEADEHVNDTEQSLKEENQEKKEEKQEEEIKKVDASYEAELTLDDIDVPDMDEMF